MQIYEMTRRKKQVTEDFKDLAKSAKTAITSPIKSAKTAFKKTPGATLSDRVSNLDYDKKIEDYAKEAYKDWKNYDARIQQSITDPAKKQAYLDRSDGRYKKELTSFVQKKLLNGRYIPNLINRDEILSLIDQLSDEPEHVTPAAEPAPEPTPPTPAPPSTAPEHADDYKAYLISQVQNGSLPKAEAQRMWNKFTQEVVIPANMAATRADQIAKKNAETQQQVNEFIEPNKEKELFYQLVRQAAQAQEETRTGKSQSKQSTQQPEQNSALQSDPKMLVSTMSQSLGQLGDLKAMGDLVRSNFTSGDNEVHSTGVRAVDAMLVAMGFKLV